MDIGIFSAESSWQRLKNSSRPVAIYGTGNACETILRRFDEFGIVCSGIFASEGFVRDRTFCGFKVRSLDELESELGELTICAAFGSQLPEVMRQFEYILQRHELIVPDLPVAGDVYFSAERLLARRKELQQVYELLEDDMSRQVMENVLAFKHTGDIDYLKTVFSDPADDFRSLIKPRSGDIYADLGAYNGDTAEQFIAACPDYSRIYAFEPDKRSFRKCTRRLIGHDRITLVNACAWDRDTLIGFSQSSSRQSHITSGTPLTAARSLDSVLCGQDCTIIKSDVEGAEMQALNGSRGVISRCRPRLAVSAYHRPFDLLDLPMQILSIEPSYKLFLRQPPYYPAWDTMIYAI